MDELSNLLIETIYKISEKDTFSKKERSHDCYADIIETIQLVASDYNRIENKPSLQIFLDCKSYQDKTDEKKIRFIKKLITATAMEDEIKLLRKQFKISSFNTETKPEIVKLSEVAKNTATNSVKVTGSLRNILAGKKY